ncbi:MAG: 4-hydroxythreonine-4-phosphate dehydrogenase PdxA [Bacteroidia bacterium]|nr:4-hydroxythreonine-4-phosphate dehydrogenase PdxA [Bacteroidia bacterium]
MKIRKTLRIGITIGDIGGIGPELIIRALKEPQLKEMFTPIIYGPAKVLNIYRKVLDVDKFSYNVIQDPSQAPPRKVSVIDPEIRIDEIEIGSPSKLGGECAVAAFKMATEDLKKGEIDALVTMPIDKATIQADEFKFPGHTEYLAQAYGVEESLMLMVSEKMKIGVVSGHVPVSKIHQDITANKVAAKLRILDQSLRNDFNIERPRIAVLGLNPHAGDNGLLGREEIDVIFKVVEQQHKKNPLTLGPYSADGFFGSGKFLSFDGILAMYHDQGLIPFKLLSGFHGVNVTVGLEGVRTSPDHGVAYDLAGQNRASLDSFIQAIFTAMDIYRNRTENLELQEGSIKVDEQKRKEVRKALNRPDSRRGRRDEKPGRGRDERKSQKPDPQASKEELVELEVLREEEE